MNNEDLKPCPFCGGEAVTHTLYVGCIVECLECAISTACENTKAEAIAAWNRRVCVKQNAETLDTNSVASSGVNAKLTYADIKKMVKPLEWKGNSAENLLGAFMIVEDKDSDGGLSLVFDDYWLCFGGSIAELKQAAQEWLVDLVAAALGVERSGE